jgi:hypothetical protein
MTTQFLSKQVRRDEEMFNKMAANEAEMSTGNPNTSTMKKHKPGFAPFATSSRRQLTETDPEESPAPGCYEIATTLHENRNVGMSFKSKTDRFKILLNDDCAPPPGHYVLKSTIKNGRPKIFPKPYMEIKGEGSQMSKAVSAPAIPSRSNALGYETLPDGSLARSHSNIVGFTGKVADSVGPFEYDPKFNSSAKYKNSQQVTLKVVNQQHINTRQQPPTVFHRTQGDPRIAHQTAIDCL